MRISLGGTAPKQLTTGKIEKEYTSHATAMKFIG